MALLVCARTERGNLRGVKGEREANGELDAVHGIVKTTTRSRVKSDPLHLSGWRGRADDENVISDSGWAAPSSTAPFGTHRRGTTTTRSRRRGRRARSTPGAKAWTKLTRTGAETTSVNS